MGTSDDVILARRKRDARAPRTRPRGRAGAALTGGGTDGNEQLTTVTGAILIVLLAVIGFTIPQLRQFISVHLFVGMLLIGPVLLKMASTGYRFIRYYTGNSAYVAKGPPELILRLIGPIVMLFHGRQCSPRGIALLFAGPSHRDPWLLLHKVTFIVWVVFMSLHVARASTGGGRALGIGRQAAGAVGGSGSRHGRAVDRHRRGARRPGSCWRSC